jgi:hypothetical protein
MQSGLEEHEIILIADRPDGIVRISLSPQWNLSRSYVPIVIVG